ncbi:class IIb bacteriocin, lactobin A/cerein 7B family [Chryseobacterium potabilaquae]|nr:class IIb bacteriocin, lactobin A/cerein 7B family [Chryseobacterium potabilaquae]
MNNLKLEELSSQEMKNVEGGFFPLILGGAAIGWLGVDLAAAGLGAFASAVTGWGVTQAINYYWGY